MPNFACPVNNCGQTFTSSRGLSVHLARCSKYKRGVQQNLNEHRDKKLILEDQRTAQLPPIHASVTRPGGVGGVIIEEASHSRVDEMEQADSDETQLTLERRPSGLPRRKTRLPARYRDLLPPPAPTIPQPAASEFLGTQGAHLETTSTHTSPTNSFGVYRVYSCGAPSYTPDDDFSLEDVADSHDVVYPPSESNLHTIIPFDVNPASISSGSNVNPNSAQRFENPSIFRLMMWYHNGAQTKSLNDLNILVQNVIRAPDFKVEDFDNFDAGKAADKLFAQPEGDTSTSGTHGPLNDGWYESSVPITLACDKRLHKSEAVAPTLHVAGLYHRKPLDVIKAALRESNARRFYITPFEEYWAPQPDGPAERIYSELYNSDAYLREHGVIRGQVYDDALETVVVSMMLWSDSTHLASFGSASLWPIYLFFGNQSKYDRAKPTTFSAHHLAYIPELDDTTQDKYLETFGKAATKEMLTHLRRELMQSIWTTILDDEFMDAYARGFPFVFQDGIERRVFPRIFTYSADYPEKVLLSCIKFLGKHPCPRCLIEKDDIADLGTKVDIERRKQLTREDDDRRRRLVEKARRKIYMKGIPVNSTAVSNIIAEGSLTPTRNTFSRLIGPHGANFYSLFVVDLLHEFELGVWRATFTHLIRILYAQGGDAIQELNWRYRDMPSFGSAIRKFGNNASAMKKLAARDFEDLLQCAIPAFDRLLDDKNNEIVLDLLFELGTWHALAKLRLHTESTVSELEYSTTRLGSALRKFARSTCEDFITVDLPSEEAARGRRKAARATRVSSRPTTQKGKEKAKGPKTRKFNLKTYKMHALGDYAKCIRLFGTSDGYSTQTGELEHRRCKRFYPRVHKGKKHYRRGIAKHVLREHTIHNMGKELNLDMSRPAKRRKVSKPERPGLAHEEILRGSAHQHYQLPERSRDIFMLDVFLRKNRRDPAVKDFLPHLRDHLLGRILHHEYDGDDNPFSDAQRAEVQFRGHKLYQHKVLRVNYTTYDLRREQDYIKPITCPNIMVLRPDGPDPHPYWYARVIGIFHAIVNHPSLSDGTRMDFLWVRWYGSDIDHTSTLGFAARRLPRIGFVEDTNDTEASPAFGFVDPGNVIRSVYLPPIYREGRRADLLGPSIARSPSEGDEDYCLYYVNFFADRDLFMRFFGGGVGHSSTREACSFFLNDRYPHTEDTPAQSESDSEDNMEGVEMANRNRIRIRFRRAEEDILEDSDLSDQEEELEHELTSDSESGVSEVLDFGYERAGSDEESDGDQDDDRGPGDEGEAGGDDDDGDDGGDDDVPDEFEDLGFASF